MQPFLQKVIKMVNILLCGANGKMGNAVKAVAAQQSEIVKIVAGFDVNVHDDMAGEFLQNLLQCHNLEAGKFLTVDGAEVQL